MRLQWLWAFGLLVPLTGCIGSDGASWQAGEPAVAAWGDRDDGRSVPTPVVGRADGAERTEGADAGAADRPQPGAPQGGQAPDPWRYAFGVASLADCRILYNLVSAGIAEASLPRHVSIPLTDADGATYDVFLAASATPGETAVAPPGLAAELCIGFTRNDVRVGYSDATYGTVPAGADRMFIAGDLLVVVDIAMHVAAGTGIASAPGGTGWTQGPWPLLPIEPRASILIA